MSSEDGKSSETESVVNSDSEEENDKGNEQQFTESESPYSPKENNFHSAPEENGPGAYPPEKEERTPLVKNTPETFNNAPSPNENDVITDDLIRAVNELHITQKEQKDAIRRLFEMSITAMSEIVMSLRSKIEECEETNEHDREELQIATGALKEILTQITNALPPANAIESET